MTRHLTIAACDVLERELARFRAAIAGIPDADLAAWKPAAERHGGGPMSTFSILGAHITGAGTWRLARQVYGDPVHRDRDAEFASTATAEEIAHMLDDWLAGSRERLAREEQPDLASLPDSPRQDHPDWTRLHWLLSMLAHTGIHVGHAQLHRQLWNAEKTATG